ncbi:MAG: flagellar hook-associated protein FlgK, partial [Phycisphaerae bacterium]|nr:flagellar hook-associated protein FlgK [Phycisphaerae bacterium]
MGLTGTLSVGRSALASHQVAIQVTSNNIANANTPGYTRQVTRLTPLRDQQIAPGQFVGTGVGVDSISRAVDESLVARLRASISGGSGAEVIRQWLGRVEAAFNELSDQDLSTRLSTFFGAWSNLANKPQDIGLRQIVLQAGDAVANWMRDLRTQLSSLATDVDERLQAAVNTADDLARKIAQINTEVVRAEGGSNAPANGLRDQRDVLLGELAELINVQTRLQPSGAMNVYVNSEPLVMEGDTQGVAL